MLFGPSGISSVVILLVLVNVCRAGTSATECIETAPDAARNGDLKGIQSCLDVGWDVNAKDLFGRTALRQAAYAGKVDVIAALSKAGADVNAKDKEYGWTALHVAAKKGKVNAIAALIKAGAVVNAKNNGGRTALDLAIQEGQTDTIQLLSKHEL